MANNGNQRDETARTCPFISTVNLTVEPVPDISALKGVIETPGAVQMQIKQVTSLMQCIGRKCQLWNEHREQCSLYGIGSKLELLAELLQS